MRRSYRTSNWGSSTRSRSSSAAGKRPASGYANIYNTLNSKITSYKAVWSQATGPAKVSRPSPATLNSLCRWIDKGAVVHKVSATQVKRWAKPGQKSINSATAAKNVLTKRFGKSAIKAVTRDKSGAFLVACAQTVKGRKFSFPR